ncbi:MAG: outer membrane beta-barrel protein [Myxococcota bacterium]|nr:outer membrane beta-barrel protein [Myxococcota bacterium]
MRHSIPSILFVAFLMAAILFSFAVSARSEEARPEDGDLRAPVTEVSADVQSSDRPPVYFTAMLLGAMMHEDSDNRLTSHDGTALVTPGLALRVGGTIDNRHFIGGRFQGTWRSTQDVRDSVGGDNEWGAVSSYYLGPEYRYAMPFGLYFGASAGFSFIFADNDVGSGESPECNTMACVDAYLEKTDDHASFGVGMFGTVGYEYRLKRNFAVTAEAFVGLLQGEDENNINMTNATYGLAVGVGI